MSKPWRRAPKKPKRLKGPCFVKGCNRRGGQKHECRVCEELVVKRKLKDTFSVQFCDRHATNAENAIKKHVLSKHKTVAFLTALKVGYED